MKKNNNTNRFKKLQELEKKKIKNLNKKLKNNNINEAMKTFGIIAGVILLIATGLFLVVPFFWYAWKDR